MRYRSGCGTPQGYTRLALVGALAIAGLAACGSGDDPAAMESAEFAEPSASIESQEWTGLAAGASVTAGDAERFIKRDLAAITVRLRMRNESSQDTPLLAPASLVGAGGETLADFRLLGIDGREVGQGAQRVMIPAQGSAVLEQTKLTAYEDLQSAGSMVLELPRHGLRLDLAALPPHAELYEMP